LTTVQYFLTFYLNNDKEINLFGDNIEMIIYKITNKTNGKSYVGQSIRPLEKRWSNHINESNRKNNRYICRAIKKYGKENFILEVLCECTTPKILNIMETFYIISHKTFHTEGGYNLTYGGNGRSGFKLSEETKKKISISNTGKKATEKTRKKLREVHLGYKHSEEAKKKIIEALKGRVCSEETRKKLRSSNIGKKHKPLSEEARKKIGDANRGKHLSEEHRRKISEKMLGVNNHNYGKHLSDETKKKISENVSGVKNGFHGKKHSDETKKKWSEIRKGRKHSEETKKKMSESRKKYLIGGEIL
jgi:group I intron endonuclease